MSSRQKSFFDQDHKAKATSQWQKARSFNGKPVSNNPAAPPPAPKSPIRASSQSKSKLKAFQFTGSKPGSPRKDADKENDVPVAAKDVEQSHASLYTSNSDIVESMEKADPPALVHSKTCPPPSTPGMRLPLADLIGNAEDAMRRPPPKEQSPEEQIGWIPNSSNSALSPGQRRKRAQSSSPMSSSQNDASTHFAPFPAKEPLDLQKLQQSLKTPLADPAADLWSRYATGKCAVETPIAVKLPSFAHLINDSSPHSVPRTPGGSLSGLRRWASCGTEWPASKAKRRKVNGASRDEQDDVFVGERQMDSTELPTKVSRVGLLVERMQATLAHPVEALKRNCPSSSSPLPEKASFDKAAHESPPRLRHGAAGSAVPSAVPSPSKQGSGPRNEQSQSSEYGSEDIDMDGLGDVDLQGVDEPTEDDYAQYVEEDLRPVDSASQHYKFANGHGYVNKPSSEQHFISALETVDEDDDEFGDDGDITAEDLDNAVAIFDDRASTTQHAGCPPYLVPPMVRDEIKLDESLFDDDDDDDFDGSDLDEEQFAAAEVAATQAYPATGATQKSLTKKSRAIQRYLVKQVTVGRYSDSRGLMQEEKTLLVDDETTKLSKTLTLRQSWLDTHCSPGAFVHVVGNFSKDGQITINDSDNLIIVHPDHLVSATAVADSFDCLRKAVLQDRIKATSQTSKPTIYGTILHEVFQEAMKANKWNLDWLDDLIQRTVIKHIEGLFEAGAENTNEALEHLRSKMPELQAWASAFVAAVPGPDALAEDRNGKKIRMSVTKLLDVEEHVWSPTYGLKGNVDATVEVIMEDEQGTRALTVPFEVKTGKFQSAAHRAQTALYTLLLSDRYDIDVVFGVLFYMETSVTTRIPAIRNELRHMVMQRNELASYVRERLQLPPMLRNPFKCGRCYAKTSCFLYHKLAEDGNAETAGVKEKFDEVVGRLEPANQTFFKKWDDLLTKEESEMFRFRRELWTMLSQQREKLGRCFAEVVIEPGSANEQKDAQKINRYTYTFVKRMASPGFSFLESQITVGEPIVISSEQGHFALANGYVTKVSATRIGVAVDRRLHNARKRQPGFDEMTNQTFAGIMTVQQEKRSPPAIATSEDEIVYRLDKDEFSNGMATVRNNLLAIMDNSVYRSSELRSLIVENVSPVFKPMPTAYTLSSSSGEMNADQRAAIDKVMSAKDYALVLGMPGTGKTTTIAHIIRALVARGKSVLLTSYTHTAVDNILLKLRQSSISVLRLGVLAKIHPEVQAFANLAAVPRGSIEELQDMYMTPQVVATTCLGIGHQLFHKRVFDYCIVDEASQITLPVCLGPIRMARTFVLVGDHYQLPPLVQNKEAADGGLDVSLFKLLSERQPASVATLVHQYRMCEDVMLLANTLVYDGRLKCGNDAVAGRTLLLPSPLGLAPHHSPSPRPPGACAGSSAADCWLADVLSPTRKVVFANTDTLRPLARETARGSRIVNEAEATLTAQMVLGLLALGVAGREIGVITFYRSQLALLRQALRHTAADGVVEMHTADKFQGRDKEVVLVSCVRSNEAGNVGDLLRDWRRVNVAVTRARSKLVLIGSRGTLASNELLAGLLRLVAGRGWAVDLPAGALGMHSFEEAVGAAGTQKTPKRKGESPAGVEGKRQRPSPGTVLGEGPGVGNRQAGGLRKPDKVARVGHKALFSGARPVLKDVLSDLMGEDFID